MPTVFIGGLTFKTTTDELTAFLNDNGVNPVDVRIIFTREGASRGFAYADFDSEEESEKCVELDGQPLDGRNIRCEVDGGRDSGGNRGGRGGRGGGGFGGGQRRGRGGRSMGGGGGGGGNDNVHDNTPTKLLMVKNLSWATDNERLKEIFPEATDARVCKFRDTGKSRGFGFVEYDNVESATSAREMVMDANGDFCGEIDGRKVDIVYAIPREEFGGGRDFS